MIKKQIALSPKNNKDRSPFSPQSLLDAPKQKKPGFSLNLPFPRSIFAKNPVSELSGPSPISDCARDHRENVHRENDRDPHENARALHENARARGV